MWAMCRSIDREKGMKRIVMLYCLAHLLSACSMPIFDRHGNYQPISPGLALIGTSAGAVAGFHAVPPVLAPYGSNLGSFIGARAGATGNPSGIAEGCF